jgi:hypothetical protein
MRKTYSPLECAVQEAAFLSLKKLHPEMIDAISRLLALGETPDQIAHHVVQYVNAGTPGRADRSIVPSTVACAAEYLQRIG